MGADGGLEEWAGRSGRHRAATSYVSLGHQPVRRWVLTCPRTKAYRLGMVVKLR